MANVIQLPRGTAAPASLSKSELAIRHIAANATASSSSMLYIGEDAGDDGVTVRALGTGMTGDSGQGGATIGGTMTFAGGTDITTSVSGSTVTITSSAGGGSGDITAVVAGTGLSGGATSGSATLNVDAAQTQITSVGTIGTGVWQGTAITSSFIGADSINNSKIADNSIDSEHYVDDSIDNAHLADDAVDHPQIANDAIRANHIDDDAVQTSHIQDAKVTTAKIANDAVTAAKLADDAVVTANIANDAVTEAKIADSAVNFDMIKPSAVQLSSESFADNDTSIMTSAAIADKIEAYGYSTGDITGVTAGTGLSGGGSSGGVTLNVDAAQTQITSVGTIGTGTWQGTAVASAYLDSDTAHLSTTQTFSGAKTFSSLSSFTMDGNTITGVDDSGEFTDDDAHIMTSAGVNDRITSFGYTTNSGDITGVTAGTALSGGGSSGGVTVNLDDPANLSELTESTDATDDKVLLWDESASDWKYMTLDNLQDAIDTTGGGSSITGTDTHIMFFDGDDSPAGDANGVFVKATGSTALGGASGAGAQFTLGRAHGSSTGNRYSLYEGVTVRHGANGTIQVPAAMVANLMTGDVMVLGTADVEVHGGIVYSIA